MLNPVAPGPARRRLLQSVAFGFVVLQLACGLRSWLTDDARFGWAPYASNIDYAVSYAWLFADGSTLPYYTGELPGKAKRVDSAAWHNSRFGLGSVCAMVTRYAESLHSRRPPGTAAVRATITYVRNGDGQMRQLVLEVP